MAFKLHLMIVSFIIVTVYLVWMVMTPAEVPVPVAPVLGKMDTKIAPYTVAIIHASWGMNCPNVLINTDAQTTHDPYVNTRNKGPVNNKLRDDNVFAAVSLFCNSKEKCEIAVGDPVLGDDPAPDCTNKVLEIQYRCYSYDRPWTVRAATGSLTLDCAPPAK